MRDANNVRKVYVQLHVEVKLDLHSELHREVGSEFELDLNSEVSSFRIRFQTDPLKPGDRPVRFHSICQYFFWFVWRCSFVLWSLW